jgi:hypothetical protein
VRRGGGGSLASVDCLLSVDDVYDKVFDDA